MTNYEKQQIINDVTNVFRGKQWFNGAGFVNNGDKLTIAYNFYPALDLKDIKEKMSLFNVEYELRDIETVKPGSRKNDIPSYIKQ